MIIGIYRAVPQYFNSIKVQLERVYGDTTSKVTEFQFHKGTIRTPCQAPPLHYYFISIP